VVAAVAGRWGLAAARYDYWFTYTLPFCRMDGLLLGALVALAATSGLSARALARWAWAVLVLAAAGVAGVWAANPGPYLTGRTVTIIGFTAVDLFFAAALALVVAGQPAGWRALRFRPLVLVGTHSYAVYLVHFPVILCAFQLLATDAARGVLLPACEAVGSALPLYLAWAVVVVGASLLVARATWVLVERPCLGLKRYFPQRSGAAGTRTPPE
jgi:peptidoglycan/LPS O-acetylase OafA/YrhL